MRAIYTPAIFLFATFLLFTNLYSQQYKWHALPNAPYTNSRFEDIFFIDVNTGWIVRSVDSNGVKLPNIYKTTDGGESWLDISDTALIRRARCVGFANANTGWIGTLSQNGGNIFKTTDGGYSWMNQFTNLPSDTNYSVCGLYILNENTVFGCGRWFGPARFYKTTNGGTNWAVKDLSAYADRLIDLHFFSQDSGFAVGGMGPNIYLGKGVVLFTSDGGETWISRYTTPNATQWGWKINFPSKDVGYISLEKVGGFDSYIIKTTNGGQTWNEKHIMGGIALNQEGIGFVNENTGWLGGWNFYTYKTINGGTNWAPDPWGYNVNRFRFLNDTLAYAVGRTVYKYERDTSVGISTISSTIPGKYHLSQNYPNPFNPTTKIQFAVLDYEHAKLTILDVLGREIRVLVDKQFEPGYYEYTFDADGLNSGIYFYRIETFRYTETRKMVLLK